MNKVKVEFYNIQHVEKASIEFDFSQSKLICLVGKNGVGKTTLIRALRNISDPFTFQDTASKSAIGVNSAIIYSFDDQKIEYLYDTDVKALDTRVVVDPKMVLAELPIPHGNRFLRHGLINSIRGELHNRITSGVYSRATELISFLKDIYRVDKFDGLMKTDIKGGEYYFILKEDDYYIREDHFSSGEYFVIQLYKMITSNYKLVVIDELDISVDASAQVSMISRIRDLAEKHDTALVFSTHSLAMMKVLRSNELHYIENDDGEIKVEPRSYAYVKSILFGFWGYDRYILTEDEMLVSFLEWLIKTHVSNVFYRHKIIFIGGAGQVVSLMERNEEYGFLSEPKDVIAVLDGDKKDEINYEGDSSLLFSPVYDIEGFALDLYTGGHLSIGKTVNFPDNIKMPAKKKFIMREILKSGMKVEDIFELIAKSDASSLNALGQDLEMFLKYEH